MNLNKLISSLTKHREKTLRFVLPTGSRIAPHAHVTEVARVDKRFIDCGGKKRTDSMCRLQTWLADDTDHRLTAGKLADILEKAEPLLETDTLEVDVEYEVPFISQFPIESVEADGDSLFIRLGLKHTDCLAKDKCGPAPQKSFSTYKPLPSLQPAKCCS